MQERHALRLSTAACGPWYVRALCSLAQWRVLGRHAGASRVQVRQSACPQDAGDSCASPRVALSFTSGHVLECRRERSLQRQHARLPVEPVLPEAECHCSSASAGWRQALPPLERLASVMLLSDKPASAGRQRPLKQVNAAWRAPPKAGQLSLPACLLATRHAVPHQPPHTYVLGTVWRHAPGLRGCAWPFPSWAESTGAAVVLSASAPPAPSPPLRGCAASGSAAAAAAALAVTRFAVIFR